MGNAAGRGVDGDVTERERAGRIREEDGGEGWEGWEAVVVVIGLRGAVLFSCGSVLCMRRGWIDGKETVWFEFNGSVVLFICYWVRDNSDGWWEWDRLSLELGWLSRAELWGSKAWNWHPCLCYAETSLGWSHYYSRGTYTRTEIYQNGRRVPFGIQFAAFLKVKWIMNEC